MIENEGKTLGLFKWHWEYLDGISYPLVFVSPIPLWLPKQCWPLGFAAVAC